MTLRGGFLISGLAVLLGSLAFWITPAAAGEAVIRLVRPTWQPGYTWTYLRTPEKTSDQKRTIEYRVLFLARLEGANYYVLQREGKEYFYSKDLGFRLTRGTRVERENRPAFPPFRGLWEGRRSWDERTEVLGADQAPRPGGGAFRVVGRRTVNVPAGSFDAVHITFTEGGKLSREYWYAPRAKWIVREKVYWREGGWTDELEAFQVK